MTGSVRHVHLFLAATLLIGWLPAQDKPTDLEKLRTDLAGLQKKIETLREKLKTRDAELAKLRNQLAARKAPGTAKRRAPPKEVVLQIRELLIPPVKASPIGNLIGSKRLSKPVVPVNPLLKGGYLTALGILGRARIDLDRIQDPSKARKKLDEMDLVVMEARRGLWEVGKAAGKEKPVGKETPEDKAVAAQRRALDQIALSVFFVEQQLVGQQGDGHEVRGIFQIGRAHFPYVAKGSRNPLVKGNYEKALARMVEVLKTCHNTKEPAKARKLVDEMSLAIMAARRAVWTAKQAEKKTTTRRSR